MNKERALREITNVAAAANLQEGAGDVPKPVTSSAPSCAVVGVPGGVPTAFEDNTVVKRRRSGQTGEWEPGHGSQAAASGAVQAPAAPAPAAPAPAAAGDQRVQLGVRRSASVMTEEAAQRSAGASILGENDVSAISTGFAAPESANESVKIAAAWLSQSLVGVYSALQQVQRTAALDQNEANVQNYLRKLRRLEEAIIQIAATGNFSAAQPQQGQQAQAPAVAQVAPSAAAPAVPAAPQASVDAMPIVAREEHTEIVLTTTSRSTFEVLQRREREHPVNDYRSLQSQVSPHMRAVLVDWMREVAAEHKIHDDTYFLAVRLVDRLLTVVAVPRRELQLVGAVCVLLAAKLEEMHPLPINNFEFLCDRLYNRTQFLTMENVIMRRLGYQLHPPYVHKFIGELVAACGYSTRIRNICEYVSFVTILDYTLSACSSPSLVAAAIVACVVKAEIGDVQPFFRGLPTWCHGEVARLAPIVVDAWKRYHDRWCTEGIAAPSVPADPLPTGPQGQEIPLCRSAFERFNTEEKGCVATTMRRLDPVFEGITPATTPLDLTRDYWNDTTQT